MKVALIGPPQSGKSTLFAALTATPLDPASTGHVQAATVQVPDERIQFLSALYKPKKITPASIEIVDFPGISSSDEHGRERYKKHVPEIRQCDALVAVVREFESDAVPPHRRRIDPQADLLQLGDDFIFADLETVTTRIHRIEQAMKKPKKHDEDKRELFLLERCRAALDAVQPLSAVLERDEDAVVVRSFAFLSQKPVLAVVNVGEDRAHAQPDVSWDHAHSVINICADAEAQIALLDPTDRAAFLEDLGLAAPARDRFIQACYETVGLISFLTVGPDEVRAWAVRSGSDAVEAAGKVHTDIARGFIRAEVVAYEEFKQCGDMKGVKAEAKLRQEGKHYIVQDGDIIHFKFNV